LIVTVPYTRGRGRGDNRPVAAAGGDSYDRAMEITANRDAAVALNGDDVGGDVGDVGDGQANGHAHANVEAQKPDGSDAEAERGNLLESLRENRRDLEEVQRISRIGSWTLDPATGEATWSSEMHSILGLDPNGPAIWLDSIATIFSTDSVREVREAVQRAVETGEPWNLDLEMVGPDGASRGWVASNGAVERGREGSVAKIRGTMQDVSDQRRLEVQLAQSQRLEAVGLLAGGIAHDFNNLLTAIHGYAELARESIAEGDQARDDIEQVLHASDRAAELIRQLLAFSRRQMLQPRVVGPAEIVSGTLPMLRRLLGAHIDLVTHAQPGVGRIRVDPSQLEQVIVNLAVNARDAMPDGGRLAIETANAELDAGYAAVHADATPGSYVALIVSDTGSGMDAATQARIFEPFFTTKAIGQGTGMGLATVYGIVRQSGGSIYVYSEPGRGTSFKVYLPRIEAEDAGDATDAAAAGPIPTGSEVILLVEDAAPVRDIAARVLASLGYRLLQAPNAAEALILADAFEGPIDLLLTDVTMPGMQGHHLAAQLRSQRPDMRVMFVSGFTESAAGRPGVAGAGSGFLAKPFTGGALARAVREALDGLA